MKCSVGWSATIPEVTVQGAGSIPILSFTADEIRRVHTEVAFCGLDRDVAKKELNLLQFAAGGAAEPSATSTEIMRCELVNANLGGELLDDMPDELFRYSFAPNSTGATHTPEKLPCVNSGGLCPVVQQAMHPIRDGNGSDVTCLSDQVHDCPMFFALLQVAESRLGEFMATRSTG